MSKQGNQKQNKLLLLALGSLAVICILISMANHNYYTSHFTVNVPDPEATTKTEIISEKVYLILKKNQEEQEGYDEFLAALQAEGIKSPKIDMKFYLTAGQAYRNRLLTRAYIVNRLS